MAREYATAQYGNWVSSRLIAMPALCGMLLVLVLAIGATAVLVFVTVLALATLFIAASLYFAYARFRFSRRGGDIQGQILKLILDRLDWNGDGRALDIGCGNGRLAIAMAQMFPHARVVGVDTWGGGWGYAKAACERNAAIEGVAGRISFEAASAAHLPFADDSFDLVVSNLTFHEVRGAPDKRALMREALRVLRPSGQFVFQDLSG